MAQKNILLVENDDFYVEVIGTFVKLFLQYELTSARTPAEALVRAREQRPDLVLLDLDSDGNEALEFAERMRDDCETKRVPILALSHTEAGKDEILGRGCSAFLAKPFKVRELEAVIARLVAIR